MPNLILQIDDTNMVKKYILSTNNIVVYFYASVNEDKFNNLKKIKTIFPNDLPEDVHISFVKCNLTTRYANITKEYKNHQLMRHNQKILIRHKNNIIICKNTHNKIDKIIKYFNTNKLMKTRSSNQNIDFLK